MGTRALHVGILESLFMLIGFDRNVVTAMRLSRKFYGPDVPMLSLMYAVRGRRFRDTPWFVGGSSSKALEYFRRAAELDPRFINNYEDIAVTYEKMRENDKAIKYWQKVIELPLQERYRKWGIEAKERAEKTLERLKAQ
jgi:tetratricopeptide (TPR) repeat protein